VTGVKPFAEASAWKRISTDSPPPRRVTRGLSENWNRAIVCCLERNPAYRFQSAQAVLDALEGTASAARIPPKPFLMRLKRATRTKAGLVAVLFLLAMALVTAFYRYSRQKPEIPSGTTVLVTD